MLCINIHVLYWFNIGENDGYKKEHEYHYFTTLYTTKIYKCIWSIKGKMLKRKKEKKLIKKERPMGHIANLTNISQQ